MFCSILREWRRFHTSETRLRNNAEESSRFLKKAAQKLLAQLGQWALAPTTPMTQVTEVFLLLFVHKKKALPSLA
jgi:hypothetical protein